MKTFLFKAYTNAGAYVTVLKTPNFNGFRKQINSGLGQLQFTIPRKFDDFDEDAVIKLNGQIDVWVTDGDTGSDGKKIYTGFISSYAPTIDGANESVVVTCLGNVARTATSILKDGVYIQMKTKTATGVIATDDEASACEISAVVKSVIDYHRAEAINPVINYSASSVQTVNLNMTYTFTADYIADVLNKCLEFCPDGWYWYIDALNILNFKNKPATPTHTFIFGKHFKSVSVEKNMESVANKILFSSGDNTQQSILELYEDTDSASQYGDRWEKVTDNRVSTTETADNKGASELNAKKNAKVKTKVVILDNNSNSNGYDIESIEPGDTCKFRGFNDVTSRTFTDNMLIVSVEYTPDQVTLELEQLETSVARATVELEKRVDSNDASNMPKQYGIATAPASTILIANEVPTGTIDSSNKNFTVANTYITGTLRVFRNGIRLKGAGNDFTESAGGFTMISAPITGDVLLVDYNAKTSLVIQGGAIAPVTNEVPTGTVDGSNKVFQLANTYIGGSLQVYRDGQLMKPTDDYTESQIDKTITFVSAPYSGTNILVSYRRSVTIGGNADAVDGFDASITPLANTIPVYDGNKLLQQEPWRTVGNTGEPAFQNSWVNYGGAYYNLQFMKDSLGFVHLRGSIKSGAIGSVVFTLPAGYRPSKYMDFKCWDADVWVSTTGEVYVGTGSNGWINVHQVYFMAEQ